MLCSGSKKRGWISYRNTFPLQGSLSNPKSLKKNNFIWGWGSTVALPDPGRCCLSFTEFLLLF